MKERPILFSGPMVRAILRGEKTQTRRILIDNAVDVVRLMRRTEALDGRDEPTGEFGICSTHSHVIDRRIRCRQGTVGDRLWVREAWSHTGHGVWTVGDARMSLDGEVVYRADGDTQGFGWFPSIHMPREFSRLTLMVTDLRVQRLQDISEADAKAEGVERMKSGRGYYSIKHGHAAVHFGVYHDYAKEAFAELWDHINGAGTWEANPWVYALTFEVEKAANSVAGLKSAEGAMRSKPQVNQVA